ncbi:ABC transporter permease subunit [Halobaculum halobium]|uniref:ABC transporter permease subunit n=1 Tax=Halobaculum halobium TaxID=3032281 RepID=A0ABD5TBD5_9EURY|nr:ABC transporter permease subunit [Halobaculum sp. SYNS20]
MSESDADAGTDPRRPRRSADPATVGGERQSVGAARPSTATLAIARYEGERLVVPSAVAAVALSLFGSLYVWIGPQVTAGVDVEALTEALPPALRALFGLESLGSVPGLLASEFYTLGWIVGLAAYVAYVAAGRVAGGIATDRLDATLAAPTARRSVIVGLFLALLVPVVVVNAVVPLALYGVSLAVGDALSLADLFALHALSVPYLLLWGAVGLVLGVAIDGGRTAGRVALGVVFATWIVEAVVTGSDYERVGAVAPARYLDPTGVLVRGEYALDSVAVLLAATALCLVVAVVAFARRDV